MHRLRLVVLAAVALGAMAGAQGQDRPDLQLKAAVYKETVEGDLQGAIALYKQIVSNGSVPRPIAAAALLGLGGCYEKVGEAQARGAYERLIADYPEQTQEVATARARLTVLKAAARGASSVPTLRLVWSGTGVDPLGAVSPDGRLLAYVNWNTGDLAVADLRSGQSHMVTNKGGNWETDDFAYSPRWSPDGKRLAYYWYRGKGEVDELRITDLSGKSARALYSSPYAERRGLNPVGWFPDGSALLGTLDRQGYATEIVRVSLDGGAISPVWKVGSIGASRVCLSPDGRYIAFDGPPDSDSLNTDVFLIPASGGRAVPIVTGPYDDRLLDWTPDGHRVLVASNRSGAYDAWLVQVDEGRAVGSPLLLRKELGMVFPIGFSRDGSFYFAPDVGVRDVVLADWDPESQRAASAPRPATEHFSGATRLPAWSPDGRKLAYLVDRGFLRPAETRVRIRDMETGAERTLVDVNGSVYALSWSPDGSSLAMTVMRTQSPWRCQLVEVDSGRIVREFTSPRRGEGILRYVWGPEAGVAYYVAGTREHVSLLRRDLRTGDETSLYTHPSSVPLDIAVSPDGRQLAVVVASRLLLIPATGGEARELVREAPPGGLGDDAVAWSPDGKYVYFGRQAKKVVRLRRVAVTGGAPEDLDLEIGEELRFRPDGRRLAFTRLEGGGRKLRSEIWVMENVLPALERVKR